MWSVALALFRTPLAVVAEQAARQRLGTRTGCTVADAVSFRMLGWSQTPKQVLGEVFCRAGRGGCPFGGGADILVCLLPDMLKTLGVLRAETIALLPPRFGVVNGGPGWVHDAAGFAAGAGCVRGGAFGGRLWRCMGALASRSTRARYVAEAIGEAERAEVPCILYDFRQNY